MKNKKYSFLQQIFSVKNQYKYDNYGLIIDIHKVFTVFFIKMKFKMPNSREYRNLMGLIKDLHGKLDETNRQINSFKEINKTNIINILNAMHAEPDELFCMRNNLFTYILSRKFFDLDRQFVFDFLYNNCLRDSYKFYILNKSCPLYIEHIKKLDSNEVCWKYKNFCNCVVSTIVSLDGDTNEVIIRRDGFGFENLKWDDFRFYKSKPQKYVKGQTILQTIMPMDENSKKEVLERFYDYLFNVLADKNNPECISGEFWDCHLNNFVVAEDKNFVFIDYEWEALIPIDRGFCLYYAFCSCWNDMNLYEYFKEKYNVKANLKYYHEILDKRSPSKEAVNNAGIMNKNLMDKYFGHKGLLPAQETNFDSSALCTNKGGGGLMLFKFLKNVISLKKTAFCGLLF